MRNVAVLVDGDFYLRNRQPKSSNVKQVAKHIVDHCLTHLDKKNNERLYRIFFYDCPPLTKKIHNPLTKEVIDFSKTDIALFRQALHEQLKQTRNIALRMGILDDRNARWRVKTAENSIKLITGKLKQKDLKTADIVYHAPQKSVDMKIGLDIASMAYKKIVKKIVLISGDSDFVPASKLARREGIEFILDAMHKVIKADLQEHIDGLNTPYKKSNKI